MSSKISVITCNSLIMCYLPIYDTGCLGTRSHFQQLAACGFAPDLKHPANLSVDVLPFNLVT